MGPLFKDKGPDRNSFPYRRARIVLEFVDQKVPKDLLASSWLSVMLSLYYHSTTKGERGHRPFSKIYCLVILYKVTNFNFSALITQDKLFIDFLCRNHIQLQLQLTGGSIWSRILLFASGRVGSASWACHVLVGARCLGFGLEKS